MALSGRNHRAAARASNPNLGFSTMVIQQATSPVIRARNQATIREGATEMSRSDGEQGRAAVLSCFEAGSRACGLSQWSVSP